MLSITNGQEPKKRLEFTGAYVSRYVFSWNDMPAGLPGYMYLTVNASGCIPIQANAYINVLRLQ
jgi:hypothetical protein